ncbi:hypothetical protein PF004_g16188 [Phytophthora fragariae]|uniref:Uncharacterized protein n=1 Tax=Phytophthora fragariae TaxID=53985 RepID=A0A6G0NJ16_9STRA|nr:hypothetical protein PF004_g16188 [Phytophthora fragariae]
MITGWNLMLRANASFVERLEAREEVVGNYSLRDLRARVCSNAWDVGRVCYVQAEAEAATPQVAQARTELEAARQSNRELLARTRELERRVFGAPQEAA